MINGISVIVPAFNAQRTLPGTIKSILNTNTNKYEIIIVDDGSDIPVNDYIQPHPRLRILRNHKNLGPAFSRNKGALNAEFEVLLFIDSDVYIEKDTLPVLERRFNNSGIEIISGMFTSESIHHNFFSEFYLLRQFKGFISVPDKGDCIHGGIFAVRKALFIKEKGFSLIYERASVEDLELGRRLYLKGYHIFHDKQFTAVHDKHMSFFDMVKNDFFRTADRIRFVFSQRFLYDLLKKKRFEQTSLGFMGSIFFVPLIWVTVMAGFIDAVFLLYLPVLVLGVLIFNHEYLRFYLQRKGRSFLLKAVLFLLLDIQVIFAGALWGLLGCFRVQALSFLKNIKYLPYLRFIYWKQRPVELTFFITNKCDFMCRHCFYHEQLNNTYVRPMSLDEIKQVFESMPSLLRILISGGEPFLAENFSETIKTIYKEAKPLHITIPTNGFYTDKIISDTEEILRDCQNAIINIPVQINGCFELHTEICGVNAFNHVVETINRLKELKLCYANIIVGVAITQMKSNQDTLNEIYDYVKGSLQPDYISFSLIRNTSRYNEEMNIDLDIYASMNERVLKDALMPHFPFSNLYMAHRRNIFEGVKASKTNNTNAFPCYSGKIRIVMTPDGNVYPCETLMLSRSKRDYQMGKLREVDFDIVRILESKKAYEINRKIRATKCKCSHECDLTTNLFFNFNILTRTVYAYLKDRFLRKF